MMSTKSRETSKDPKSLKLPAIISLDEKKIHGMKFQDKFDFAFRKILQLGGIAVVALICTIITALIGVSFTYNSLYQQERIQGEIRIDIQALSKAYLWALSSPYPGVREEQLAKASEKFADFDENLAALEKIYSGNVSISTISGHLDQVEACGNEIQKMFEEKKRNDEIFNYFNDTLYPAIDAVAGDLKEVSADITEEGATVYHIVVVAVIIGIVITALVVLCVFLYLIDMKRKLAQAVLEPVNEISKAAADMAAGRLNINIGYTSGDELGKLAAELNESTTTTEDVFTDLTETLGSISEGDFSHSTAKPDLYKEDYQGIKYTLDYIVDKLSITMKQIKESSGMVSQGAANMQDGAAGLAEGATDQAAAIEELTASVQTVNEQTKLMADSAQSGSEKAIQVRDNVVIGTQKMSEVTGAMDRIADASKQIEQVSQTIEDIASQTQLLSLNASIEAARAGEVGRGFAVVAEEISNLASESTQAVKDTQDLVNGALEEISIGASIVKDTQKAFETVRESVDEVVEIIKITGEIAEKQSASMEEISGGIEQISNVIQDNTATAQQSSAVSNELSEQSSSLNELLEQFIVK
ncbi:MAG: methyl-accepting chemotaxis protein [Lachnospiraceae bacterium]|nr:methyl-accepting chemotaxis protein [Lachnospiraceae bacterium]